MWKIKQIFDGDYGCEERAPGFKQKLSVTLVDDYNLQKIIEVEDEWLRKHNLTEGDKWPYKFWGWDTSNIKAVNNEFPGIETPWDMYDALSEAWCADTCAPRMRDNWSKENMTLGQCSITAFLVQDVFGGKVYGILRNGGNYHCYNVIGNARFDLTSEQFGDEILDYDDNPEQFREVHFSKEEKYERYLLLRKNLLDSLR